MTKELKLCVTPHAQFASMPLGYRYLAAFDL